MDTVIAELRKMIVIAKLNGQFIYCHYQNLWWSPEEFGKELDQNKFRWGRENFQLRDPKQHTVDLDRAIDEAEMNLKEWQYKLLQCELQKDGENK